MKNYYQILGLENNATIEEIKASYKYLAKKFHPDMSPDDAKSKKYFQDIQEAYECLSDNSKRRAYDRQFNAYSAGNGQNESDDISIAKDRALAKKVVNLYFLWSFVIVTIVSAMILRSGSNDDGVIYIAPVLALIVFVYFLPSLVAYNKGHEYRKEIFILNIFSVFANMLTPLTFIVFYVCLLIYSRNKVNWVNAVFMVMIGLFLAGMSAKHERRK
jgi:hypothetical protein